MLSYVPADDVLFVDNLKGKKFVKPEDVDAVFDAIDSYCRAHCAGRKVFCLVDYAGVSIASYLQPQFARRQKAAVDTYSITTIRYGADLVARTTIRSLAIRIHRPSNLYESRSEAMQIVRGIRMGRIKLDSSHPAPQP